MSIEPPRRARERRPVAATAAARSCAAHLPARARSANAPRPPSGCVAAARGRRQQTVQTHPQGAAADGTDEARGRGCNVRTAWTDVLKTVALRIEYPFRTNQFHM